MTQKYEAFVEALQKLCDEHKVHLSTSMYDLITVWDADPRDDPVAERMEDKTKQAAGKP